MYARSLSIPYALMVIQTFSDRKLRPKESCAYIRGRWCSTREVGLVAQLYSRKKTMEREYAMYGQSTVAPPETEIVKQ